MPRGNPGMLPQRLDAGRSSPLRVLLAEDNRVNQRFAVALLERDGHQVTVVDNGAAAVAAAASTAFDAIFMDVQMPEMSGLDATAWIRLHEQSTGVHATIIAMTAHALQEDRERCLEAGMDDYVAKPISIGDLRRALQGVKVQRPVSEDAVGPCHVEMEGSR